MPVLSDAPFFLPFSNSLALQNGAGAFTFGRTSSAGIVDSATGLYTVLTAGNPRCDSVKRLFMNSAAVTNTLKWSRDLTNGVWVSEGYGSEFVTNGDFSSGTTGWTATQSTLAVVSGELEITSTATNFGQANQSLTTLVDGERYSISGYARKGTAETSATLFIQDGTTQLSAAIDSSGTGAAAINFCFNRRTGTPQIKLTGFNTSSGKTAYFDNISVKRATVNVSKTETGIDGVTNSCSLLTARVDGAKIYQTITAAASAGCSGAYVKRSVGTGKVWFTRDNYATLLDITDLINSATFSLCAIENTSVLNPTVGFKFETAGDAIISDGMLNHLGTEIAFPSFTTSSAVTVNAETLTYQTSGNFSDTAGTIIATVERRNWANNNGVAVGKAGSGLSTSSANSGVEALDGTNTVNGPAGSTISRRKIGMKWSGSSMKTFAGGNFGAPGIYDGSFNLTTIAIMPQANGYIRDVAIWPTELSDADMLAAASEQSDFSAAMSFAATAYANTIHSVSASMPFSFSATGYASVIHSVSAAIGIDFNAAMRANVIHSVSADIGVTFNTDFDSTWILPTLKISGIYAPPTIPGTYGSST